MPNFAYSGRTRGGQTVTGERAADTIDGAIAALRREQIVVTRIDPATAEKAAAKVKADEALTARLAEYNALRANTASNANAQLKLALWCEQNGLPALTSIAVNEHGLPGMGFYPVEETHTSDVPKLQHEVFMYDWFAVVPPTEKELDEANKAGKTKFANAKVA